MSWVERQCERGHDSRKRECGIKTFLEGRESEREDPDEAPIWNRATSFAEAKASANVAVTAALERELVAHSQVGMQVDVGQAQVQIRAVASELHQVFPTVVSQEMVNQSQVVVENLGKVAGGLAAVMVVANAFAHLLGHVPAHELKQVAQVASGGKVAAAAKGVAVVAVLLGWIFERDRFSNQFFLGSWSEVLDS